MPTSEYYVGLLFFVAIWGAVGVAAEIVVRRRLPSLVGATRVLAWATLATAGLIVAHLVPAALTILSRETALVAAALLLAGAWITPAARRVYPIGFPPPAREPGRLDRALAAFGVAAFAIWIALAAAKQLYAEPVGFDAASAYLPTAARWVQEGSIWQLADWLPGFFFGSTPGNGTVILSATMLPWDNDFLTHFAIYPFVALTALAIYALARELGAPSTAAALIGVALTAAPVVVQPALVNALLDPVLYATFTTGLLFLVRHHRTGESSELVLAGIALGLAFGTKFYGFTSVPIVIAVWAVARLLALERFATVARQALVVVALVAAFGGIWVARNLFETGNPAFPVDVDVLGVSIFDAPEDPLRPLVGSTLADYFDDPGEWTGELRKQFRVATGIPLLLLAVGIVAAVVLLARRRRWGEDDRTDGIAIAGVAAAVLLALAYALTPYSAAGAPGDPYIAAANVRYGIPALIAAAAVGGWLSARIGAIGLIAFEAVALGGTFDALRVGTTTPRATVYAAFGLAALGLAVVWGARRLPWRPRLRPSRFALAGVALAGVIALALLGSRVQEEFNSSRYIGYDPAIDSVLASTGDGATVGLSGTWVEQGVAPIYPSFGHRLQNRVEYVGPTEDGLLGRFDSRRKFQKALKEADYDVLLIGRAAPFAEDPRRVQAAAAGNPVEQRWARAAGFEEAKRSERFVVMIPREG